MMAQPRTFPPMPQIGLPESYYAKGVHHAEKTEDTHAREAFKVGQYITLALEPHLRWEEKLKYFQHAVGQILDRVPVPTEDVLHEP